MRDVPDRRIHESLQLALWAEVCGAPPNTDGIAPEWPGAEDSETRDDEDTAEFVTDYHWSRDTALDPKHRPQSPNRPSSTVRREWWRYPQEAHLLELEKRRYRRLVWPEIEALQGFPAGWVDVPGISDRNRIEALGDAVPPPLASAIFGTIGRHWRFKRKTAAELCAGSGGLASGLSSVPGLRHVALVERWDSACRILKHRKPWDGSVVHCGDVRTFNWDSLKGKIGLLSGGPPCQPWSIGGARLGHDDHRDLLISIHEVISAVRPEVFVFENVPGLVGAHNDSYLRSVLSRMRRPSEDLRYGVACGVLNAADFGVPQVRRRLVFVGLSERPSSEAFALLDSIYESRTHRNPARSDPTRRRWITVGEALSRFQDPGGWREWAW
jgi:site-specific DNA-cytosine methylase